jgi:hypothetical protein
VGVFLRSGACQQLCSPRLDVEARRGGGAATTHNTQIPGGGRRGSGCGFVRVTGIPSGAESVCHCVCGRLKKKADSGCHFWSQRCRAASILWFCIQFRNQWIAKVRKRLIRR